MIDFDALRLDPIYAVAGVNAQIMPLSTGIAKDIVAIEKTLGELLALGENNLTLQSVKAAAAVRMSELAARGLARADLKGGTINLNDKTWSIHSTRPVPGQRGEAYGELYLLLQEITP